MPVSQRASTDFQVAAVAAQLDAEPRLLDPQRADVRGIEEQLQERTVASQAVGLQDRFVLGVANLDAGNRSRREPADRCGAERDGSVQHGGPADKIGHQRRMGDDRRQQADQQHQAHEHDAEPSAAAFSPWRPGGSARFRALGSRGVLRRFFLLAIDIGLPPFRTVRQGEFTGKSPSNPERKPNVRSRRQMLSRSFAKGGTAAPPIRQVRRFQVGPAGLIAGENAVCYNPAVGSAIAARTMVPYLSRRLHDEHVRSE